MVTFAADQENRLEFEPVRAKTLRLELSQDAAGQSPAVDELLVFGPETDQTNLADKESGVKINVSSCIDGYAIHRPEHLNDGLYGNDHSWVADPTDEKPTIQLDFADEVIIDCVVFSRDRLGQFPDRVPHTVDLFVSTDGKTFQRLEKVRLSSHPAKPAQPRKPVDWADVFVPGTPPPPGNESPIMESLPVQLPKHWPTDDYGFKNLAMNPNAKAQASSSIQGYAIHQIKHLNDGLFGNDHSWIAEENPCWAEIDLGDIYSIYSVAFGSDSTGKFQDRGIADYSILVATEYNADSSAPTWTQVTPRGKCVNVQYRSEFKFEPTDARYVRINITGTSFGMAARIDELEVFGRKERISLSEIGPLEPPQKSETFLAKQNAVSPEEVDSQWRLTLVDEEYAWLKTFGRADINPGLIGTPYPIKRHPNRLPEDVTTLVSLHDMPVFDGRLEEPCWQNVSNATVRVALPGTFEEGALVEYVSHAFLSDEMLLVGISTNRLLSSHVAILQTPGGSGVVAITNDGHIVWRIYDQDKPTREIVLEHAAFTSPSSHGTPNWQFEFAVPLTLLPGIENRLAIRSGIGGRYTPKEGHQSCFYPSDVAVVPSGYSLGSRGFTVRLVNHGTQIRCVSGLDTDTIELQAGETLELHLTPEKNEIGPERNVAFVLPEQSVSGQLHLFQYDPVGRVFRMLVEMLGRIKSNVPVPLTELARTKEVIPFASIHQSEYRNLFYEVRKIKRELFFSDPNMKEIETVLFEKRHPLHPSHNYSDYYDSVWRDGGGIYTLKVPYENGRFVPEHAVVTELFKTTGMSRHPVADFAVEKIYFTNRPSQEEYWHIMEMNPDGTEERQLTDGPFQDLWPCPLPDGDLAFITTRCRQKFLCWEPQASVLHRMDKQGKNMQRLSFANLTEFAPSVARDGRILWTRSEYLDKGADYGHTLWYIKPDGTLPELTFGNTVVLPQGYANGREIPGTNEICAVMISHFGDLNGPVCILDIDKGRMNPDSIHCITPEVPWPGYWARSETFREPFPIATDLILVSHASRERFGLFVIDRLGNRELLYIDPLIGSMCPTPLCKRPIPKNVTSAIDPVLKGENKGAFFLEDVYVGIDHVVPRGAAKYLRVCREMPHFLEKYEDGTYRASYTPFMEFYASPVDLISGPYGWTSYVAKGDLGTVEIEQDGSASFTAPAGAVLFFELLDENYTEIQRMRSVVQLQPGEIRSCVGCHEDRSMTPMTRKATLAARQKPKELTPSPWGAGAFDYQKVVQPVLDKNCISCHDSRTPNKADLTGTLDQDYIPSSFKTLIRGGYVHHFDWQWQAGVPTKAEPYTFGTVKSRLWTILKDGHHTNVMLTLDEQRAIKCWIDLSCPLWSDYKQRRLRGDANAHDGTCVMP